MGPRAGLDGRKNLVPTGIVFFFPIPDRPAPSSVTIPTELPGPQVPYILTRQRLNVICFI